MGREELPFGSATLVESLVDLKANQIAQCMYRGNKHLTRLGVNNNNSDFTTLFGFDIRRGDKQIIYRVFN